jgi:hypothetical protein
MVEASRNGRLPTNDQIDKTLPYILDHSPVDIHKLSSEGRKVVQDMKDIMMVQEKNADQLLQNFIRHTRAVDPPNLKTNGLKEGESLRSDSDKGNTNTFFFSSYLFNIFGSRPAPSHPPLYHPHQLGSPKASLRFLNHRS